ncbi:hypothetical protein AB1Y20_009933 [Prymnesium parvum]|uniref:Uncharacterized protein n=1 Tax=Prymnesium parvum TaxID=97485 RepID=A0AB34K5M7_PRYPA
MVAMAALSDGEEPQRPSCPPSTGALIPMGVTIHIPHSIFPDEPKPKNGYWVGKTVLTTKGGRLDVGIKIRGEAIFTRPISEVKAWVVGGA